MKLYIEVDRYTHADGYNWPLISQYVLFLLNDIIILSSSFPLRAKLCIDDTDRNPL